MFKRYALITNGVVTNIVEQDTVPPADFHAVESAIAHVGWTYVGGVFTAPIVQAPATIPLPHQALNNLNVVTSASGQIMRCMAAGVPVPANWIAYVAALRAIANGTDKTSTALPPAPAFVAGT